jgi:hypothetical protein
VNGKGNPTRTDVHDFCDKEIAKAIPYGVLDVGANEGWMSVGDDQDTAGFAINAIRRRWATIDKERYPDATTLLVTADAGGSNGYRNRLYKAELAKLATEIGLVITLCHYPPGTSKWNKIVIYTGCSLTSPGTGGASSWKLSGLLSCPGHLD